jgi:hypothetical protein
MATERAATIVAEMRAASSEYLRAWRRLQDVRDAYDAVGGADFFTEYFQTPGEITANDLYAGMVSCNAIDTTMAAGHSANLHKLRG